MRIACLADPTLVNGFYRGIGPMKHLADRGHDVRYLTSGSAASGLAAIRDAEVMHAHRYSTKQAVQVMQQAKAHGAAIVWDDDDDLPSTPKNSPDYKRGGGLRWQHELLGRMKAVFRVADLVTAPNSLLTARFEEYGALHTRVIENYVPAHFLRSRDHGSRTGVTIGWVAGKPHQRDAEALGMRTVLQRLLDERPELHVVSIGLGLGLQSERYRYVDQVHVLDLADHTATFDIGIAPLGQIAFNLYKSNVKVKEYAAGGTAWLASPVGPYLGMGESEGGRLVADGDWYAQLSRLLDRPRERQKLAKRALKWVSGETMDRNAHRWEEAYAEAIDRARAAAHATR